MSRERAIAPGGLDPRLHIEKLASLTTRSRLTRSPAVRNHDLTSSTRNEVNKPDKSSEPPPLHLCLEPGPGKRVGGIERKMRVRIVAEQWQLRKKRHRAIPPVTSAQGQRCGRSDVIVEHPEDRFALVTGVVIEVLPVCVGYVDTPAQRAIECQRPDGVDFLSIADLRARQQSSRP
jgi:hypothetical protein